MARKPILLLVPDGMAGWPQPELDDLTPLQAASTPNMDRLAVMGKIFRLRNIPAGCPADSAIANLALLGYDPREFHLGRGPLEALNLGVPLKPGEVAYRCNLVTVNEHDVLVDYSAGNLPTELNNTLFEELNEKIDMEEFRFVPGLRYRGVLVSSGMDALECAPPHDDMGRKINELWPQGPGAEKMKQLMLRSREILSEHPLNKERAERLGSPANMAWPWGSGVVKPLPSINERYNLDGVVIAGVDLIKGMGLALGMEKIDLPGATGDYETDMGAKIDRGLSELGPDKLVYVHVEATDEAGHDGDPHLKVEMIERWDTEVIGPVLEYLESNDVTVMMAPDHFTPCQKRTHIDDPVPLLIINGQFKGNDLYDEDVLDHAPFVDEGWKALESWYRGDRNNPFDEI